MPGGLPDILSGSLGTLAQVKISLTNIRDCRYTEFSLLTRYNVLKLKNAVPEKESGVCLLIVSMMENR